MDESLYVGDLVHAGNEAFAAGDTTMALRYYEWAAPQISELGLEERPAVAVMTCNLGAIYRDMGELQLAEDMLNQAISMWRKEFGPEHPNVAIGLNHLGGVRHRQGRYGEAEDLYLDALRIQQSAYGEGTLATASALNNLGMLYQDLERLTESRLALERSAAAIAHDLPADHPSIIATLDALAETLRRQDDWDFAESLWHQVLAARESTYGFGAAILVPTLDRLAECSRRRGDLERAKILLARAVQIDRDNPNVSARERAATLYSFGKVLNSLERHDEAASVLREALALTEENVGKWPDETAQVAEELAQSYSALGDDDGAARLTESVSVLRQAVAALSDESSPIALLEPALRLWSQGEYTQAASVLDKLLTALEVAPASDESIDAMLVDMLPGLACALDAHIEGERFASRAIARYYAATDANSSQIARLLVRAASYALEVGDHAGTLALYTRVLEELDHSNTPDPELLADALTGWADLHRMHERYEEAEPRAAEAVHLAEGGLLAYHQTRRVLLVAAEIYRGLHNGNRALSLLLDLEQIALKQQSPDFGGCATARFRRGQLLGELERHAEAVEVLRYTLSLLASWEDREPRYEADVLHALARSLQALGDRKGAGQARRRAKGVLSRH